MESYRDTPSTDRTISLHASTLQKWFRYAHRSSDKGEGIDPSHGQLRHSF